MPTFEARHPRNVTGKFYCTDKADEKQNGCIGCDLCYTSVPAHFTSDDFGYAYVYKQPQGPEEIEKCKQSLQLCPVNSIGSDGDELRDVFTWKREVAPLL